MPHKNRTTKTEPNAPGSVTTTEEVQVKKDESDSQWEGFKDTLKKLAQVPKEEVDELRAEHEREKGERRAE